MKSCFYGTIIQKEWLSPTSCCDLDMHKVDPSFYIGRNKWNRPVTLRPSNIAPVSLMWINSPSPPEEKAGGIRWGVIWLGLWLPEPCPGRVRGSWCRPQCNKTWTAPGHHCSQPQSLHHTFAEMKLARPSGLPQATKECCILFTDVLHLLISEMCYSTWV